MRRRPSALAPRGPDVWRRRLQRQPTGYMRRVESLGPVGADRMVRAAMVCGHSRMVSEHHSWRPWLLCSECAGVTTASDMAFGGVDENGGAV